MTCSLLVCAAALACQPKGNTMTARRYSRVCQFTWAVLSGVAAGAMLSSAAQAADINSVEIFFSRSHIQTTDAGVLTDNGAFMNSGVVAANAGVFTGGTLTGPGAQGPVALAPLSATTLGYQSASFVNQAAMDSQFGAGLYSYSLTSAGPPALASLTVGAALYSTAPPSLTGNSFSRLQGMDSVLPITLDFSPFTTQPSASDSYQFFTVFDFTLSQFVFSANFLPANNTGVTLPALTLVPGRQYAFELNYDTRVYVPAAGINQTAQVGFDMRTGGTFTTAVPEPAAWLMWLLGLGWVGARARRLLQTNAR